MKILFSTSSLFPYRVNWLDELGKYADVDVYYLLDSDNARNTEWCAQRPKNCTFTLMKSHNIPKLGQLSFEFIKILKEHANEYDAIIMDGYGFLSQMINIRYLNKHKIEYYVNIDGMVPKDKENAVSKFIKRKIISKIPHCLCGALATNKMLIEYGAKPENIINHPFTSLYKKDIAPNIPSTLEKNELRKQLGISENKVVISVGRFSYMNGYGKGYDVLMRAAKKMSKDIGWYIIGGQPTPEFAKMKKDMGLDNLHFVDFLTKEELALYYKASDVFTLMTVGDVWGLVINEAMAYGLPIITTDKCVAGLDLVNDGENGYIIKVGDDSALAEKLDLILHTASATESMARSSLEKISFYTIESMAEIHIAAINENIKKNNR